jgi:hypothetical protein
MALSILNYPTQNSSVSSEMLFLIEEPLKANDPTNYPNYKYVLDIYVDGDLVARQKATPDPVHYLGVFDVATILRDYVPEYLLEANYSNHTETYQIKKEYTVKLGEEYDDTLYTNLVTDVERTFYRSYARRPYLTSDVISNVSGQILSNIPRGTNVSVTEFKESKWFILPYFSNVTGITITFNMDDGNGNIIGPTSSVSYTTPLQVLQINFSFQKIAAVLGLTTEQQSQVKRLVFDVDDGISTIQYLFVYACTRYTPVTLAWLNPYGAYESYTFGLVNMKKSETGRKEFMQLPYQTAVKGLVSYDANGVMYGSRRGYGGNVKTAMNLTSHLLSDAEYEWLADLFNSPDVYRYDPDLDRFVPCMISETSYEYRTYKNSRLRPLEFTIQFSDDYNSQYL